MTSRLLMPWRVRREGDSPASRVSGGVATTAILDWKDPAILALRNDARSLAAAPNDSRALLLMAHGLIVERVRPVYALDDAQPAARTLTLGRGSCSQRLGLLESVARSAGISTRVRGLLVNGRFWYSRFSWLRFAVPDEVLLAWPEFWLDDEWVDASALFGPPDAASSGARFSNDDGETLFDAVARGAVDWDGGTSTPTSCSSCDLSGEVLADLGRFNSRDELFAQHGQTLCRTARTLGGPVMSRWSAGAGGKD